MRPNKVLWFDGPEHYASYLDVIPLEYRDNFSANFSGGTFDQTKYKLVHGDTKNLARAQALIDKMTDQHVFSAGQQTISSGMVGFMPNVPNALMGQPNEMFNLVVTEDQNITTPLRIFVETTVSAGLTHDELENRGICVIALAMAMSMIRPVELYTASFGEINSSVCGAIVKIPSNPIDLDRASYMLSGIGFCRQLMFTTVCYQSKWPRPHGIPFPLDCRDICKCEPHDILINGGRLDDILMLRDPLQWVKKMIAKHKEGAETT